ncbi:MAG: efflux RND transporter periplasmic adaptor subunit [bacterium]|nr:efflux RND transporter periplasmic adaptor subunit [bacterium]
MTSIRKTKSISAISLLAALAIAALLGFYFVNTAIAADKATQSDDSAETTDTQEATEAEAESEEDQDKSNEKAPIPVRATEIKAGRVSSYISATANLVPENEVRVLAEWEGRVAQLKVEEGDRIAAGQILAALDRKDGEITLKKAQVRATTSRMAYDRAQRLKEQELLSPEDFDKIALDHEIASQELAEAEWRIEKTLIRAPFRGRVTQRMVQLGQHVRPGEDLFTVADFDPLIARIYLPEKDVLALENGRRVRITLKADESIRFDGRIGRISPVVDTATGTVKVTVEAAAPPRAVRPGAFVRVDIVRESRQAALLLPREAVVRELQKAYVFVADDGVAHKRAITLGLEENGSVEVIAGVDAGEQVIVAGQGGLKDGSAVKLISDDNAQTS